MQITKEKKANVESLQKGIKRGDLQPQLVFASMAECQGV